MRTGRTAVRAAVAAAALALVSAMTVATAARPAAADTTLSSCAGVRFRCGRGRRGHRPVRR